MPPAEVGSILRCQIRKSSRFFEPLYRSSILNYDSVTERDGEYQDASYLFIHPNDATLTYQS